MSGRNSPVGSFHSALSHISVEADEAEEWFDAVAHQNPGGQQAGGPPIPYLGQQAAPPPPAPPLPPGQRPPQPRPLVPLVSNLPDTAFRNHASFLTRLSHFKEPANLLDLASGIGAATMAARGVPVAWWGIFVTASGITNSVLDTRAQFIPRDNNAIYDHYFQLTGLRDPNAGVTHNATHRYFRRQLGAGVADTMLAVTALDVGAAVASSGASARIGQIISAIANSGPLHGRALIESGWSIWQLHDRAVQPAAGDVLRQWIRDYRAMKSLRFVFRLVHTVLPALPNAAVLGWLASATAIRLGLSMTVGDFLSIMAQHVHFRAFVETGQLPRSHRTVIINTGRGIRIPPAHVPIAQNGPYTQFVRAIFAADPFPYSDDYADAIVADPAGWNAIAHRLAIM